MARRGNYRMTPRRRAALRKAQLASAKKRSRGISKKKLAIGATLAFAGGAAAIYGGRKAGTIRRKQRAMRELNGKVTLTISTKAPINGTGLYSGSGVSRTGLGTMKVIHPSRKSAVIVTTGNGSRVYIGQKTRSKVKPIDRDSIPLYNPKVSKGWPHVPAKTARKQNRKLRKKGMIE